ncbi:MAG: hypothetical protein H5T94_10930, partial [Pseudothermotoga sp.]|nr:hypothetical protein [Pseudothermotoga sp.]
TLKGKLHVSVPRNIPAGRYLLTAYAIGKNGIYSKKYTKWVRFEPPVDSVDLKITPSRAPAVAGSYYKIDLFPYAGQNPVEREPLSVKIDEGFIVRAGNSLLIPYMGADKVSIVVSYESTDLTIPLTFSGNAWVEVVSVYGNDGKFLGVVENTGEPLTISYEGYEAIVYVSQPEKPVSFKTIQVKKTLEGFLRGKKVLISAPEYRDSFERISQVLKEYGCDVKVVIVQNKRDEINFLRKASGADFIFLIGLKMDVKAKYDVFTLPAEADPNKVVELLKKAGGFE